jgi:hypothetical protein
MKVRQTRKWSDKNRFMDRFGGEWRWKFGFQASAGFRCVIVDLFAWSYRIEREEAK